MQKASPNLPTIQVKALPLSSSGSRTRVGQELASHNQTLTMHLAQVQADRKYDPAPAKRPTQSVFIEKFSNPITSVPLGISLATAGVLVIIYCLIQK